MAFKKSRKAGFTIVELLTVVTILSILMTIVIYASGSAIKQSRANKSEAMRVAILNGIHVYHQQKGEWPGPIESIADNSTSEKITLSASEADAVIRKIVSDSLENSANPLLDCSILFTGPTSAKGCNDNHKDKSSSSYCGNKKCAYGLDFLTAYRGDAHHEARGIEDMSFGFPGTEEGRFRRFTIKYNRLTDNVTVER